MTEINDIKAGTYLLVARQWEEYTSKPNEPFDFIRHRRGAVLELNVEDARRLVLAGAVLSHDPTNPRYAVQPDGTVVELQQPDPAAPGLVIPEDQFKTLAAAIGLPADAASEDFVRAVQQMQDSSRQVQAEKEQLEARLASSPSQPAPTDRPRSDRIEDIVTWVSGDQARAQIALDGERTSKGDRARPQLVTALEEILTSPGGGVMYAAVDPVYVRPAAGGDPVELHLGDPVPDDADEQHVAVLLAAGALTYAVVSADGQVDDITAGQLEPDLDPQLTPAASAVDPGDVDQVAGAGSVDDPAEES